MRGTKEQSWCPVCGALVPPSALVAGSPKQHRCPKKLLKNRDAADKRIRTKDSATVMTFGYEQRLRDGFTALQESEE